MMSVTSITPETEASKIWEEGLEHLHTLEIAEVNAGIIRDVSERQRKYDAIQKRRQEVEAGLVKLVSSIINEELDKVIGVK